MLSLQEKVKKDISLCRKPTIPYLCLHKEKIKEDREKKQQQKTSIINHPTAVRCPLSVVRCLLSVV